MANIIHFTQEGFDKALTQKGVLLVDFWATWCGPCRMLAPVLEQLAEEYDGKITVGKVDIDEETDLALRYGIQSIPTVMLFVDGAAQTVAPGWDGEDDPSSKLLVGFRPKETYAQLIDSVL